MTGLPPIRRTWRVKVLPLTSSPASPLYRQTLAGGGSEERHELERHPAGSAVCAHHDHAGADCLGNFHFRERTHPARGTAARTAYAPPREDRIGTRVWRVPRVR